MYARSRRKIIGAHVHLYEHLQNRHEFLEIQVETFHALIGDCSSLSKTYSLEDYLADAPNLKIDGLVWTELLSADPIQEVLSAQQLADTLTVPTVLVGLVDLLAPDLESRLDIYSQCSNMSAVREHLGWDETGKSRRFAKRPDLLTNCRWLKGLKLLAKYRFKCSLEVFAPQLPSLLNVARLHPDIRFSLAVMGQPLSTDASAFSP